MILNESYNASFKIGTRAIKTENGSSSSGTWKTQEIVKSYKQEDSDANLLVTIGFITCSCAFLAVSGFFMFKYRVAKYKWLLETGNFGSTEELTLRSFSYSELKRSTNGFRENLDLLFSLKKSPEWNGRVRFALDGAREFFISMLNLLMPDQTRTFTLVRGTRGYMAPEWSKKMPISVKADVYSYGVVLLEIVCCRRTMEVDPSKPEEIVLINWVNKELNKLVRGQEDFREHS
ncbi:uncharacterized protein LOC123200226 [Mangifera indica]|uniref:uncharacterized protein LOC123200226 n=1 Tax=Mangifera indica TaxID=29780 RepID=UPI001CFBF019|nr:uncharacterized protein LOC123200226 [Mangifera indica]